MKNKAKITIISIVAVSLLASCSPKSTLPENKAVTQGALYDKVTQEMLDHSYWTAKNKKSNNVLISDKDITKLNNEIAKSFPKIIGADTGIISKDSLTELINRYRLVESYYINGKKMKEDFVTAIDKAIAIGSIPEETELTYGVIVSNTPIKSFPTTAVASEGSYDKGRDLFQVNTLQVADGVVVYINSTDNLFSFVHSANGYGWVSSSAIASATKEEYDSFVKPDEFVTVTSPSITLDNTVGSKSLAKTPLDMGVRLPINQFPLLGSEDEDYPMGRYEVSVPRRDKDGMLNVVKAYLPINGGVCEGYLPYTSANVVKQALSLVGSSARPNGYLGSRDGDLTLQAVYSVFGIDLPADFTALSKLKLKSKITDLSKMKENVKLKAIKSLSPGSLLLSDNHAAIFIGVSNEGDAIISHVVESAILFEKLTDINANILSTVSIAFNDKTSFINECTTAIDFTKVEK